MKRQSIAITVLLTMMLFASCIKTGTPLVPGDPQVSTLVDTTITNISYGSAVSQKLDLGLPANRSLNTNLVVVIHGGGWSSGDKTELSFMLEGLKQRGFAVANINYRLSPQSADNYTMELDDVDSAVQFTLRLASQYTFNGQKLYITGHSAGGHLSLCYAYTRNSSGRIKAAASMAGPCDLFAMAYYDPNLYAPILTPFLGGALDAATLQHYKDCSPQYQAGASSPPTIFFHGELDVVVKPAQSANMAYELGTLNVANKLITYPLVFHDWWTDYDKVTNTLDETASWFTNNP